MLRPAWIALIALLGLSLPAGGAEFTIEKTDDGLTVNLDGKLVTRYLTRSNTKPILWPVIGPTGKEMTRAWPMGPALESETKPDHPHQRSFWFTHGDVNGVDFWAETGGNKGTIAHKEFVKQEGGSTATIVSRNDWLAPDGKKICEDERTLRIGASEDARWIDFDIVLKASEGPVTFGETKEGSFGVRTYHTLRVDVKLGGKIINSQGQTNDSAWAKPAAWVDYHGPIDGETLGIAILNHPDSFRFPTTWHVRTYGLFAANPFGGKDFKAPEYGAHKLEKGETLKLRYRVLLHKGDEKQGKVAEAFEEYSKQ